MENKLTVKLYSDGACLGNPGPGGYGIILIYGTCRRELSGGEPDTTNNRMELRGVIEGLKALKRPCEVVAYSDSKYVVQMVTEGWLARWEKNNWMRNKKEPAKNVDLLKELSALLRQHQVRFEWVKGHADNPENNRCDALAVLAAKAQQVNSGWESV